MTIEHILQSWGRQGRVLPENSHARKAELIARFLVQPKVAPAHRSISKPWLPLALVGCAVVAFVLLSASTQKTLVSTISTTGLGEERQSSAPVESFSGLAALDSQSNAQSKLVALPSPDAVPSTDAREFLKTDYNTTIQSRNAARATAQLQIMIRGFGGRIDSSSSSKESGHISFVLPAHKLDAFRSEAVAAFGERFIVESIQTENLLPQKKDLEERIAEEDELLVQLQTSRDQRTTEHNNTVKSLENQITTRVQERSRLVAQLQAHPEQAAVLEPRITQLDSTRSALQASLRNENSVYATDLQSLAVQVQTAQKHREALEGQNTQLVDTVETVRGSISVFGMSLLKWLNFYLPFQWVVPSLLLLIALVVTARHRMSSRLLMP